MNSVYFIRQPITISNIAHGVSPWLSRLPRRYRLHRFYSVGQHTRLPFPFLVDLSGAAMRVFVIVIGISDYPPTLPALKYASTDAIQFGLLLAHRFGCEVEYLLDVSNLKTRLRQTLAAWRGRIASGDGLLFYLTGHGADDNGELHLLLQDGKQTLSHAEIYNLANVDGFAELVRLSIWDTCRVPLMPSGASRGLRFGRTHAVVSACSTEQIVTESHEVRGGVLTDQLLVALCTSGDSCTLDRTFFENIKTNVQEISAQQPQVYWGIPRESAGATAIRLCHVPSSVATDDDLNHEDVLWLMALALHEPLGYQQYLQKAKQGALFVRDALRLAAFPNVECGDILASLLASNRLTASAQKLASTHHANKPFRRTDHQFGEKLSPKKRFQDKPGDRRSPALLVIPAGVYHVSSKNPRRLAEFELPTRLAVGIYPVTVGQYLKLLNVTLRPGAVARDFRYNNFPMSDINLAEAWRYCAALTDFINQFRLQNHLAPLPPGCHYRLPTVQEWEVAARAGGRTPFSVWPSHRDESGFVMSLAPTDANFDKKNHPKYGNSPGPVRVHEYLPNRWGIFGCHGNVAEFTLDRDTKNGVIIKGGHYGHNQDDCSADARHSAELDKRYPGLVGFRVVRIIHDSE